MKNVTYFSALLVSLFITFSCSVDSIEFPTVEPIKEKPKTPEKDKPTDDKPEDKPTDPEIDPTVACEFNLSDAAANSTVKINCLMDLNGETISLAPGVTLEFDGGDIKNGGIEFSNGKIDGRLLSSSLEIKGEAELISNEFEFIPSRWDDIIKEGKVNSDIALANNQNLENLFNMVKRLKGNVFKIDEFDAFFEVTKVTSTTTNRNFYSSIEGVNIPSDFHLSMTENTFLRMFPAESNIEDGTIIAIRDVDNVKVTGGNLIGDRNLRSYTKIGEQGTHLLKVVSGRDVTIEGVTFKDGSKGGISVFSLGFSFNPDYKPSVDIKILNNKFINNRRMSIAFTDGRNCLIEGNYFENTGQKNKNSDGGVVGYAINIEPVRARAKNGDLTFYQKAFNILVQNNTEVNSRIGFITVIGEDITVNNNKIDTRITYSYASGLRVTNNQLTASRESKQQYAIFAAGGQSDFVFDNEVSNNTISGYGVGISLQTQGAKIFGNKIINSSTGLQLTKTIDTEIYDNDISVSNLGILSNLTFAYDILVKNNKINARGFHMKLTQLNQETNIGNKSFDIIDNDFENVKKISLFYAEGVNIADNKINGGIEISNSSNVDVVSNIIKPDESDGVRLTGAHENILLKNNNIDEPTGASRFVCINNSSKNQNQVDDENNICVN